MKKLSRYFYRNYGFIFLTLLLVLPKVCQAYTFLSETSFGASFSELLNFSHEYEKQEKNTLNSWSFGASVSPYSFTNGGGTTENQSAPLYTGSLGWSGQRPVEFLLTGNRQILRESRFENNMIELEVGFKRQKKSPMNEKEKTAKKESEILEYERWGSFSFGYNGYTAIRPNNDRVHFAQTIYTISWNMIRRESLNIKVGGTIFRYPNLNNAEIQALAALAQQGNSAIGLSIIQGLGSWEVFSNFNYSFTERLNLEIYVKRGLTEFDYMPSGMVKAGLGFALTEAWNIGAAAQQAYSSQGVSNTYSGNFSYSF